MPTEQQQADFKKYAYLFTIILIAVASYGIYIKDLMLLWCMSAMAIIWHVGVRHALYDALYNSEKSERHRTGAILVVFVGLLVILAPYQTYTYVSYRMADSSESSSFYVVPNTRTTILLRYFDRMDVEYIGDLNGTLYIIKLDGACERYHKNRTAHNLVINCIYTSENIDIMRRDYSQGYRSYTELVKGHDYEFRLIITEPYSNVVVDDVYKRVRM